MKKKIPKKEYRERFIARAMARRVTGEQIAARLGITPRHMRRIARKIGVKKTFRAKTGAKGIFPKLANEDKELISFFKKNGLSETNIAYLLSVSQPAVHYHLKKNKASEK